MALIREQKNAYEVKLLDLRNDVVFKSFFDDKRNGKLLLDFLNAVLDETISLIEMIDPHLEMTHSDDKLSVMDIRVLTDSGEQINVEIQLKGHRAFPERMLVYWAKMYTGQDESGKEYVMLKKAIQIVITNFNLLSKNHFHSMFQLTDKEDGSVFTEYAEIHVLELPKLGKKEVHQTDKLEKWLLFLKSDRKTKEALALESPTMRDAFEEITRLSQNPEMRALAISREIQLRDQLQGEYDARQDGKEEGVVMREREIVLTMYSKQTSATNIAELTGIDIEKVHKFLESHVQ